MKFPDNKIKQIQILYDIFIKIFLNTYEMAGKSQNDDLIS